MTRDFQQIEWDDSLASQWQALLRLAVAEDLGEEGDWTTRSLVSEDALGAANLVARRHGVIAGSPAVEATLREIEPRLQWTSEVADGADLEPGASLGRIEGPARGILMAERILLNFLGRMCGIATLTRRYVNTVAGTKARIYDTRKTTPGWRQLEKYAVRRGGGHNHRTALYDAVLIKDNHLALGSSRSAADRFSPAEAVRKSKDYAAANGQPDMIIEIEVDTLEQLDDVLQAGPHIVLLDNMSPATLREAVARRDAANTAVELEASGGIDLDSVRAVAESGVDRISVGALTHSAVSLDLGLDWE